MKSYSTNEKMENLKSDNNSFVLLHSFRKKTQKTPKREITKAKAERDDYLSRKRVDGNENME